MKRWGLLGAVVVLLLAGCGSGTAAVAIPATTTSTAVPTAPTSAPPTIAAPNADSVAQQIENQISAAIPGGCWTSGAGERNNYEENVFFTDAVQINQNDEPDPTGTGCAGSGGGSGNAVTIDRYRTVTLARADVESLVANLGEISTIYLDGPVEIKLFNSSPAGAISAVEDIGGLEKVAGS